MLTIIAKLFKILNAETAPSQISLALCFAMIIGLTPLWSLHNLLFLLLVLLLRVNLSAFLLGWMGFTGIAYLLDPVFHMIGFNILTLDPLQNFWTMLYNSTLWRLEKFNNSIVMGSLLFSLAMFIPVFIVSNLIIQKYREYILTWVRRSRIAQILKASKVFHIYQSLSDWGGAS